MRALVIVGALLLGLIGLGMSLCGGGVLLFSVVSSRMEQIPSILGITVPFILLGGFFVWRCVAILKKKLGGP